MMITMKKMLKKIKYYKIKSDLFHIIQVTKQLVEHDPRRIVHSIKVGVALTLVSFFYYFDVLYQGFGIDAIWAVLTTVIIFEFSVGATLGKGVNRIIATIIGGMSAVGAHRLSSLPQKKLQPFLLGLSVFITASVATFIRFYPKMKARFDYGLLIFILTFSLICVSGYRDDEVIEMAHERISSLLIGSAAAVIVCVLICPVWAGTDLHNLGNILNLSIFFQGFGLEYFKTTKDTSSNDDNNQDSLDGFKSVVDSKNNIDTLLNFVKWEPRHGGFKKSHPWTEYQKISELCRHCGYRAQVLHGYLYSQHQAPKEVKDKFREVCVTMSTESGKALKEVSIAMTKMRKASKAKPHLENAKEATQDLNLLLDSNIWKSVKLSDVTGAATVASLLAEVVGCMEEIGEAVQELASLAKFKDNDVDDNDEDEDDDDDDDDDDNDDDKVKFTKQGSIKRRPHANHVIQIDDSSSAPTKSHPVPTKSHPAPTKSHPLPTKTHPAATKPHPAPTKPHAAPNKPHAVPNKPHAAPTKSHPAPTKPHAASTKSHPASLAVMHQQTDAE